MRLKPSPCLPCPYSGRTSSASPAEPRGTWSEEGVLLELELEQVLLLLEEELEEEEEEQEEVGNPDSYYSLEQTYLDEYL